MTPYDSLLMGIDGAIRQGFSDLSCFLLGKTLKSFHPTTPTELTLGLALEAFLECKGDPTPLREAYLAAMVEQGFDRVKIDEHINTPFFVHECAPLW